MVGVNVRSFMLRTQNIVAMALLLAAAGSPQLVPGQAVPAKAPPVQVSPGQISKPSPGDAQPVQSATLPVDPETKAGDLNQGPAQVPVEFQSHGLEYEALTREGITVMFATLPPHIKDFNVIQVTVTNGSELSWTIRPSDFSFVRQDGTPLQSVSADDVVESLLEKASRTDVIKLQLLYEDSIYALANFRSTNGYEQRREAAMAQFVNRSFKAAAAASAITLVGTKLKPGDSTDGAVFFVNRTKTKNLGAGRFVARTCGQVFVFQTYGELKAR
ncbi:MAG TPA: hypothetical protein VK604_25630 [Bryobacteraceae bacterium]|nr:hypothetical protein [Bryobacteraceae bacterium]